MSSGRSITSDSNYRRPEDQHPSRKDVFHHWNQEQRKALEQMKQNSLSSFSSWWTKENHLMLYNPLPEDRTHARIMAGAYRKSRFYATTSFHSEIPVPYFSWAEYQLQHAPHV
jgi:hypothetical protein